MGAPQHSISSKLKTSVQLLFMLTLPLLAIAQQDPNQPNQPNNNSKHRKAKRRLKNAASLCIIVREPKDMK